MSAVTPDLVAGRLISFLAGTATVPVVNLLARRLMSPASAFVAGLVLALSPIHIWYSQEGRPHALAVLLVSVSYLALVGYVQDGGRWRLGVYGASLLAGLFTEYSVAFAFAPQAAIIGWTAARGGARRARGLCAAAAGAGLGFVYWLPRLARSIGPVTGIGQFEVTPPKSFSSKRGSLESLKVSTSQGLRPRPRQIRATVSLLTR